MKYITKLWVGAMEEGRKKYILDIFLKILWTFLTILVLLGALVPMTIFLGWWKFIILCLLGLIAGVSISTSVFVFPRDRIITQIALILGVLVLVSLAVYLGSVAVRSQAAFNVYNASLIPFVAYALGTLVSGLIIGKTWQKKPQLEKEEVPAEMAAETSLETPEARIEKAPAEEEVKVEEEAKAATE